MIDSIVYTWRNLHESGEWRPGWQPHPHPFPPELYRLRRLPAVVRSTAQTVVFRHQFFRSHLYFASFSTTERTIATFDQYLSAS